MKVIFYCDSGANIHSRKEEEIDLEEWGIEDDEWTEMDWKEQHEIIEEWAYNNGLELGWRPTD